VLHAHGFTGPQIIWLSLEFFPSNNHPFSFFFFFFFFFFPVARPYNYVAFSFLPPLSSPFSGNTVFAYPIRLAFALRPGHQD
jgi:hypothetical protein